MLEEITTSLNERVAKADFPYKVKFDFRDDGKVFINGPAKTVTNDDAEADTTIIVKIDDFVKMAQGQMNPMMAFMTGKLKVSGDMGIAAKIGPLLGDG
jgi:putative sterol carrier protein